MPTGSYKVNLYEKRLLERTAIKDNFLDYLVTLNDEVTAAMFQDQAGVLDQDEIEINSTLADTFTLDISNASRVIVGGGQIIDLSLRPSSLYTQVPFENLTTNTYSVGIKFMEREDGIELNPRTGDPEYPRLLQTYGEKDTPDSVVDNTTYIRVYINSITDQGDGEDHTGRTCRVWLVDPVSGVESVAYFEGTTANDGNNYVDIPYTSPDGPLGQDTGVNPPSTTAADYVVCIEGPSWRVKANKDLSTDSDYAFIGEITGLTGSIPVGFDISAQIPVFLITLDRAYDGPAGSGSGRLVYVDNEAIEFRTRTGNTDELGATLRIDRKDDNADGGSCLQTITDERGGYEANVLHFIPLTHAAGSLTLNEPCDAAAPDLLNRTGSVNWATSNVNPRCDMVWLQGFTGATSIDGLYFLATTPTATQLQVKNLDGSTPSFVGTEQGSVTILRPVQSVCSEFFGYLLNYLLHGATGTGFLGTNETGSLPTTDGGDTAPSATRFYGDQGDEAHFLEDYVSTPKVVTWINKQGLFKSMGSVTICPTRAPQSQSSNALGLILDASGVNSIAALDWFAGADILEIVKDPADQFVEMLEPYGRRAQPHVFFDDFMYNRVGPNGWANNGSCPPPYYCTGTGSTLAEDITLQMGHGGAVRCTCSAAIQTVDIKGPNAFYLDTNKLWLKFFARLAIDDAISTQRDHYIGLLGTNYNITFIFDNTANGNTNYWLTVNDGVNPTEKVDTGIAPPNLPSGNPLYLNMYFAITGHQSIRYWLAGMAAPLTFNLSTITLQAAGDLVRPEFFMQNTAATEIKAWLDCWDTRDDEVVAAQYGREIY